MEHAIGTVRHYYGRLGVATLDISEPLRSGDKVHIVGHTTDLEQPVTSMQIEHHPVQQAQPGEPVAIKVANHVREHDRVFKVE